VYGAAVATGEDVGFPTGGDWTLNRQDWDENSDVEREEEGSSVKSMVGDSLLGEQWGG